MIPIAESTGMGTTNPWEICNGLHRDALPSQTFGLEYVLKPTGVQETVADREL